MKKLFSLIVCTLATLSLSAQGWPAQYGGVMLQGFYWDSFASICIQPFIKQMVTQVKSV